MTKYSFILITSELETRKYLFRLRQLYKNKIKSHIITVEKNKNPCNPNHNFDNHAWIKATSSWEVKKKIEYR